MHKLFHTSFGTTLQGVQCFLVEGTKHHQILLTLGAEKSTQAQCSRNYNHLSRSCLLLLFCCFYLVPDMIVTIYCYLWYIDIVRNISCFKEFVI